MTPQQAEAIRAFYRHLYMTWIELEKARVLTKAQQQMFFATYNAIDTLTKIFPDVFNEGTVHNLLHGELWDSIDRYDENGMVEAMK